MPFINIEYPEIRSDMTAEEIREIVPQLVRAKQQLESNLRSLRNDLKGIKLNDSDQTKLQSLIDMLEKALSH